MALALVWFSTLGMAGALDARQPAGAQFAQAGGSPAGAVAQTARPAASTSAELEALIAAARAEGEVTFYSVLPELPTKRIANGFTAKYGIKAQYIRLPSTGLQQRFSSEAEAGTFAPGFLVIAGGGRRFAEEAIKKGWMEPISQAGIPAVAGEFPKRFVTGPTAIVQIVPWAFMYNTDKVKEADAPKTWADLANPRWKNQLLLGDPKTSDSYLDLWALLLDKYGENFFAQVRGQSPRTSFPSGTALVQGLAAGEGMVGGPTTVALVTGQSERGAPVKAVIPPFTTGLEMHLMMTAKSKVKQPNAARLFAHYLLSRDGNKVLNDEFGSVGVYDDAGLPKDYVSSKADTVARKDQIFKLMGIAQ